MAPVSLMPIRVTVSVGAVVGVAPAPVPLTTPATIGSALTCGLGYAIEATLTLSMLK